MFLLCTLQACIVSLTAPNGLSIPISMNLPIDILEQKSRGAKWCAFDTFWEQNVTTHPWALFIAANTWLLYALLCPDVICASINSSLLKHLYYYNIFCILVNLPNKVTLKMLQKVSTIFILCSVCTHKRLDPKAFKYQNTFCKVQHDSYAKVKHFVVINLC